MRLLVLSLFVLIGFTSMFSKTHDKTEPIFEAEAIDVTSGKEEAESESRLDSLESLSTKAPKMAKTINNEMDELKNIYQSYKGDDLIAALISMYKDTNSALFSSEIEEISISSSNLFSSKFNDLINDSSLFSSKNTILSENGKFL